MDSEWEVIRRAGVHERQDSPRRNGAEETRETHGEHRAQPRLYAGRVERIADRRTRSCLRAAWPRSRYGPRYARRDRLCWSIQMRSSVRLPLFSAPFLRVESVISVLSGTSRPHRPLLPHAGSRLRAACVAQQCAGAGRASALERFGRRRCAAGRSVQTIVSLLLGTG